LNPKRNTVFLGSAFMILLALSYLENIVFFNILGDILKNQFLAVAMLFIHNILVISLILLGMTFYVNLVVSDLFKREKHAYILLEHPRTFALVFTIMILFLSILRGSSLLGGVSVEALPLILLVSAPIGIIEGYGIFSTIEKTLSRAMSMKTLAYIYGIFLMAAMMEVGFINVLIWATTG
jgi:hypothetical protein